MLTISIQANIEPILRRFAALPAQIDAALEAGVKELTEMAHGQIEQTLPKVSGEMHGNIVTRFHGQPVTGVFQGKVVGDIAASVLERGRRPGKYPPKVEIEEWAAAKLGVVDEDDIFKIMRAIKTEGSPKRRRGGAVSPYHAFQQAGNEVKRVMETVIGKHLRRIVGLGAGRR